MPLELLDLPNEVILASLVLLPLSDLASCFRVGNRTLSQLILTSPAIQYRVEQQAAGVIENPAFVETTKPISYRREALRAREDRWLGFSPAARQSVKLPVKWEDADTKFYDVAADTFAIAHTTKVEVLHTFRDGSSGWKTFDAMKPILSFCIASESDMIVLLTLSISASDPAMQVIEAQLMQLSTNLPHPAAGRQTFVLANVPLSHDLPDVQMDVVDTALAISIHFLDLEDVDSRRDNCLYLVDWQSGNRLLAKPFSISSHIFSFLHRTVLVVASPGTHCLNASLFEGRDFPLLVSFKLPALKSSHSLIWEDIECRGRWQPSPDADDLHGSSRRTNFIPDREQSMFLLTFEIADENEEDDVDSVLVLISRARLLEIVLSTYQNYFPRPQPHGSRLLEVPFATWGPKCSLWLRTTDIENPITGQVGQRFASIKTSPGDPEPIRILDFNPRTVQRVQRLLESSPSPGRVEMQNATLRIVEPDVDALPGREHFDFTGMGFDERIVSEMAYVETTSKELFKYDTVHINNENILGEVWGSVDGDGPGTLDILHFG
ncbi:hypothetical protein C8F01DRAFT_1249296 [Mycena amicta]|nr:hypothetical protein C8F01DRAFT_1249296 [Mycena amicta]